MGAALRPVMAGIGFRVACPGASRCLGWGRRVSGRWGFVFSACSVAESRELGISVGVEWPQRTQKAQRDCRLAATLSGVGGWMGRLVPGVSLRSPAATGWHPSGMDWGRRTGMRALPELAARANRRCASPEGRLSAARRTDRASGGSTHVGLPRGSDDVPGEDVEEPLF